MTQIPPADRPALLLVLLAALLAAPATLAQPGALDPTFGGGGFVLTDPGYQSSAGSIVLQPDGRVVVVGSSDGDLALARYRSDGTLDPTFGAGGLVLTDFGDGDENRAGSGSAALLPDGKILVVGLRGWFFAEHQAFLARYRPDGSLDPAFGDGGIALLDPSVIESASAAAILPDGKILLGSLVEPGGVLARFLPDGTPDATFGDGGATEVALTYIAGVALQPDGRIVLGGYTGWWHEPQVAALRLHPDGTLDATFGESGLAATTLDARSYGAGLALQPDGKVVLLVHYRELPVFPPDLVDRGYGLLRYRPDGQLDPTFGDGDGVTDIVAAANMPGALVLQPDGKVVAAGLYQDLEGSHPVLARHHGDGALDPGFGDGGVVRGAFGGTRGGVWDVALQPDGRILAAGFSGVWPSDTDTGASFLLARYLADGAVAVSAAPEAPPVVIPPGGGSFRFALTLANATDEPQTFAVWAEAEGPASHSPALGPQTVTLAPRATLTRTVTQRVPAAAPAGDYVYTVHAGTFPGGAVTSAAFPVTKEAGALAARTAGAAAWTADSWDAADAAASALEAPSTLVLSTPTPHPFREAARLTLAVPAAQALRLAVYDALGREVAVLLDGAAAAGAHEVALDGRGLAAGVYVVRAEGAGSVAVRRVVRY